MTKEVSLHDFFGDFYLGLVKKDIPKTVAISLTAEWMKTMLLLSKKNVETKLDIDGVINGVFVEWLKTR